jgi:hypothetical protein
LQPWSLVPPSLYHHVLLTSTVYNHSPLWRRMEILDLASLRGAPKFVGQYEVWRS